MAGGLCPGLQSHPPAFPEITSMTVDELLRLVPSFEAALDAPMTRGCALHHCRGHLPLWPPMI